VTVFLAAPVMRTVERIELPSTKAPITCARRSVLRRFILPIMLDGPQTGQGGVAKFFCDLGQWPNFLRIARILSGSRQGVNPMRR
jgi:hypothetical protein